METVEGIGSSVSCDLLGLFFINCADIPLVEMCGVVSFMNEHRIIERPDQRVN